MSRSKAEVLQLEATKDLVKYAAIVLHGVPPTVREFMDVASLSSESVASYRIHRLVKRGWLAPARPSRGMNRNFYVTEEGQRIVDGWRRSAGYEPVRRS